MKSFERLEFDKLKGILGRYIVTEPGRNFLSSLMPLKEGEVEEEFRRLREAERLLREGVRWDFAKIPELSLVLEKIRMGALIPPIELRKVGEFIGIAEKIYETVVGTNLSKIFPDPYLLRPIKKSILEKISEEGEVKDTASPRLLKIRREKREKRQQVLNLLEKLLDKYEKAGLLRERLITIKNGRFVLPFLSHIKPRGVVHGYSNTEATLYVEPFETIEDQNKFVRLKEEEKEEVERIVRELSSSLSAVSTLLNDIYRGIGYLELLYAKSLFAEDFNAIVPRVNRDGDIYLRSAKHPLLVESKGRNVVPLDLKLNKEDKVLLVSGPNAGGKTVVLKTVGLLTLMASAGIPVPCDEANIYLPKRVYAVGFEDRQDILEGESSFTALLNEIKDALENGESGDLVLLDELLASTDPREGAALAFAVLKNLRKKGAKVIANTHLTPLKILVSKEEGMLNATMEFDPVTKKPTYRLRMGEMGLSYALEIAKRVGLPEGVIADAEKALTGLEEDLKKLKDELQKKEMEMEKVLEDLREKEHDLKKREEFYIEDAKRKARVILKEAKKRVEDLLDEAKRERKREEKLKVLRKVREEISHLEEVYEMYGKRAESPVIGKRYRVKPFGFVGELVEIIDERALLLVGKRKIEVPKEALYEV
jgi:DNA mismatch repair protein MutS2